MRAIVVGGVLVVVQLLAGGCTPPDPGSEELARIYHIGMTRADVAELHRRQLGDEAPMKVLVRPADGWAGVTEPPYRLDVLLGKFERDRGLVAQTCEVRSVPRGFMGLGVYWDYVWFDEDDRLLGFKRRAMD
jgi:hypothetical protein